MRKWIPPIVFALGLLIVIRGLMPPNYDSDFDIAGFAELPVQTGGRIMPLDSVAMNTLRIISQRSSVRTEDGDMPAIEWLMAVVYDPQTANNIDVFRIDNAEVLGLFGIEQKDRKFFSYAELEPHRQTIGEQANRVNPEAQLRTVFERQIVKLATAMNYYERLQFSLHPGDDIVLMPAIYARWQEVVGPGREAFARAESGQSYNQAAYQQFVTFTSQFLQLSKIADLGIVPPQSEEAIEVNDWANIGEALLYSIQTQQLDPIVDGYTQLGVAYRENNPEDFNATLSKMQAEFAPQAPTGRVAFEEFFNTFAPFYQASVLYVFIFLVVAFSWLGWTKELQRACLWLLVLAFIIHTFGLGARMWIQSRPPVTNLYSSAIFVGWGAVLLGILLEKFQRNGLGAFVASMVGFITLVIAHNLAKTGDTLEMMRAVLDSNFWLATHVVIITAGYSSVFLAGAMAVYYVIKRLTPGGIDKATGASLYRMVYGITCFSLLFSFVGTMLGGIWADQSWGRFWGWDPKENGALMIVLWCALMLHARWGGICHERGFMLLAIVGNMITAWSWFGTNLLGVGLHSYGFTDSGFLWLVLFWLSQIIFIMVGLLPAVKSEAGLTTHTE